MFWGGPPAMERQSLNLPYSGGNHGLWAQPRVQGEGGGGYQGWAKEARTGQALQSQGSWVGRVCAREVRNARLEKFAWFKLGARWRAERGEGQRRAGDALAW